MKFYYLILMCGRYVRVSRIETIEKRFDLEHTGGKLPDPTYWMKPGLSAPVIRSDEPKILQSAVFGYKVHWSNRMFINARAEGKPIDGDKTGRNATGKNIIKQKMWAQPIRKRRCLVPMDAFYEGPADEKLSKPYVVYLRNQVRHFAAGGIWNEYVDKETGEVISSFAIVTTVPNEVMDRIGHHRMPFILPNKEAEQIWLDTEAPLSEVTGIIQSYPAEYMNAYRIEKVNEKQSEYTADILEPKSQRVMQEFDVEVTEEVHLEGMGNRKKNEDMEHGNESDDPADDLEGILNEL